MYKIDELKNTIHCADCLTFMKDIPDKSINMILCDLPIDKHTTKNIIRV